MLLIFGLEVAGTALGFVYRSQVCVCGISKINNHVFCDHYVLNYSQLGAEFDISAIILCI